MTDKYYLSHVVFLEGLDSCGKGTQAQYELNYLRAFGVEADVISLPVYEAPWGKVIYAHLNKPGFFAKPLEPLETAAVFALDRLGILDILMQMRREGISQVYDRTHLSNAYNIAREILAKGIVISSETQSEFETLVNKVMSFDEAFRLEINRVCRARIFYQLSPELAAEMAQRRASEKGIPVDENEKSIRLQQVTLNVYEHLIRRFQDQGERWTTITVQQSGEEGLRSVFRDRVAIARDTIQAIAPGDGRWYEFLPFRPELCLQESKAVGFKTFKERVQEQLLGGIEKQGSAAIDSWYYQEMTKLLEQFPRLREVFRQVNTREPDEVFREIQPPALSKERR